MRTDEKNAELSSAYIKFRAFDSPIGEPVRILIKKPIVVVSVNR